MQLRVRDSILTLAEDLCIRLTPCAIAASSSTPISSPSVVKWTPVLSRNSLPRHVCSAMKERRTGCMATVTGPTFVYILVVNEASPAMDFRGGTICLIT